jgi:hypothetical protein
LTTKGALAASDLVRRFQPLLALLLLGLWVPATMHCGFEALGTLIHVDGNLCDDRGSCDSDACDLLEGAGYSGAVAIVKAKPALLAVVGLVPEQWIGSGLPLLPATEPEKPPVDFEPRLLPDWQFARRAARLPGAPQASLT